MLISVAQTVAGKPLIPDIAEELAHGLEEIRHALKGVGQYLAEGTRLLRSLCHVDKALLYLFCGKKTDRIKGLIYEGDGYLLLTKRLSGENRFRWPRKASDIRQITMEQYMNLMEGFDVESSIREA